MDRVFYILCFEYFDMYSTDSWYWCKLIFTIQLLVWPLFKWLLIAQEDGVPDRVQACAAVIVCIWTDASFWMFHFFIEY